MILTPKNGFSIQDEIVITVFATQGTICEIFDEN